MRYTTRGDIVLVAVLALAALGGTAVLPRSEAGHAVVEVSGRKVMELSLSEDRTVTVTGPRGETVIAVEHGGVRIVRSDCPNHDCVHMGRLDTAGEVAVCIPNRVVVTVRGGASSGGLDGVTQ